ncbi:MAG: hypothetical protein M1319_07400 [Chloroflexi bacterium]|nr:hypothetical protein [Chloroflexota bacterium]
MKRVVLAVTCLVLVLSVVASAIVVPVTTAASFGNPAMEKVWNQTDLPIAAGKTARTWMWGPDSFATVQEAYDQAPGGMRTVTYFDKSRMEITNPNGDKNSEWFVTNGLLVVEMVSGKMQTGDASFTDRWPAEIPVAGDPADVNPNGPTYASFAPVASLNGDNRADNKAGQAVTATIDKNGQVGDNQALASYAKIATYNQQLGHNIPDVFWNFMNAKGLVYDNGAYKNGTVVDWVFAMGYPITEAYWAKVMVGGQEKDVLMQAFQRRVLTYTPSNPEGWKVEMGNVGRHYYDWRYNDAGKPAPQPPADPFADVPAAVDGSITPLGGPAGTTFSLSFWGFTPNEQVGFWINAPTGEIVGTVETASIGPTGRVDGFPLRTYAPMPPGIYSVVFQGVSSGHQSILYFKITE